MAGGYQHFVPKVPLDSDFPSKCEFILVDSIKQLRQLLNEDEDYMAWDLETTGLNVEEDFIVGYSFSYDELKGYYVPVNHAYGVSLGEEVLDLLYDKLCIVKKNFVFQARFELRFMEYAGYDMSDINYYDVQVPVWFADTNVKFPSLKDSARRFLGWDMETFEETFGEDPNLHLMDPEDVVEYGVLDSLSTFALAKKTYCYYKEGKVASKIDNDILYPLMKFENDPIRVDYKSLEKPKKEVENRLKDLEDKMYAMAGKVFNISSPKQLSIVLEKLGLSTGVYTKSNYISTKKELIQRKYEETEHPFLKYLLEYKEISKAHNTYLEPLVEYGRENDGWLRFKYHNVNTPTGRFACGGDKKNDFFAKMNLQAIKKSDEVLWYVRKADKLHTDNYDEHVVMGYEFCREDPGDECLGVVEGFSPELNVRRAFVPDSPEFYWVSADFKSQELMIPTNLSEEPVWLEAFKNGRDVHKQTAVKLWGEEDYDGNRRKKAKGYNFGVLYGMGAYTAAERYNMSRKEAEKEINKYKNTLSTLFQWQDKLIRFAKKNGTVYTYFGRPRRVKHYLNHSDKGTRGYGYRTVKNSPIQGCGADLLKLAILKLWDEILGKDQYKQDIRHLSTIHDEANFQVCKTKMYDIIPKLVDVMSLKIKEWALRMQVSLEIGNSWGYIFPFEFNDEGVLVPDYEDEDV